VRIEAPVALFAHYDPESFNSIIMLADLTDDVQEFCDHRTQVDRPRAESQARLLARVHGASHADPELVEASKSFDTFTNNFRKLLATGYEEGSQAGFMSSEEFIPPSVYRRHAEIWPATVASIEALQTAPATLTHGDVHLKNWYVAGNGEMGLGDWQCISRANPVRDLAYALSTALTTENRRAWERDLLKYYLEELASAGGPRIGFDAAWQMYRQQMISALLFWTITIWVTPMRPQVQPRDTSIEFVRRISSAMEDLESLDVRVGR
jgi:aminoglycoside phosphotransferase (APT) family kinase protein